MEKQYIGPYKVVKQFRVSRRREVIKRNLTIDEARFLVKSYPSNRNHMVVFYKQFSSDKYYK